MRGKWILRTVRHGRVKIGGHWYRPSEIHERYDGRMDGLRFLFGRYWNGRTGWEPFVNLWGTEHEYKCLHFLDEPNTCPECKIKPYEAEGVLPWGFWNQEPTNATA